MQDNATNDTAAAQVIPIKDDMWTRERCELIRRTICPKGISEDEFTLFIEQCKRSGLDPLLKEAFCVGRRQNIGTKDKANWVTKYEFQPSEAGMLARAERFPDFKGIQASAVYAEDEIIVDQGKGEVVHRFNPAKRKGALVGAWARVVRAGKLPVLVWLDFSGYVQQTPLWSKIPTTMIEKCARVAALRKAYPEAFGGLYVREEMPAEEFALGESGEYEPLPSREPGAPKASFSQGGEGNASVRMKTLTGRLKEAGIAPTKDAAKDFFAKAMGDKHFSKWTPDDWGKATRAVVEAVEQAKAQQSAAEAAPKSEVPAKLEMQVHIEPAATEAKPEGAPVEAPANAAKTPPLIVVAFGPHKGKTVTELSDDDLSETIDLAHEKLMEQPKAKWARSMRENLAALETETERRCRVPTAGTPAASESAPTSQAAPSGE